MPVVAIVIALNYEEHNELTRLAPSIFNASRHMLFSG